MGLGHNAGVSPRLVEPVAHLSVRLIGESESLLAADYGRISDRCVAPSAICSGCQPLGHADKFCASLVGVEG